MKYEEIEDSILLSFAKRTKANLLYFNQSLTIENTNAPPYEVTQLVNSMLGMLVLLHEKYQDKISPSIQVQYAKIIGFDNSLQSVVRRLRNAVCHNDFEFQYVADEITGIRFIRKGRRHVDFTSIKDLENFLIALLDVLIEDIEQKPSTENFKGNS